MITSQPQENPNIPENLKAQVEAVKNQITLGEAEVNRLNTLITSSRYTIDQLVTQKKSLDEQTANGVLESATLNTEIAKLKSDKSSLELHLEDLKSSIQFREDGLAERESNIVSEENKLSLHRDSLEKDVVQLSKDKEQFHADKLVHELKVQKLKKALE